MQNGIIGDSFGTDLPETQPDPNALTEEKNRAKFSRTAEFKKLKEDMEARIRFYQNQLPNGELVSMTDMDYDELGRRWQVATSVIGELRHILSLYENAQEVVDAANQAGA